MILRQERECDSPRMRLVELADVEIVDSMGRLNWLNFCIYSSLCYTPFRYGQFHELTYQSMNPQIHQLPSLISL